MSHRAICQAVRVSRFADYQRVKSIFASFEEVKDHLEDVDDLEPDGSNYAFWMFRIGRVIEHITGIKDYLQINQPLIESAVVLVIDRCVLDVIRHTLPSCLFDETATCLKAHDTKARLRRIFDPYGMPNHSTGKLEMQQN
ncbi:uncharacterized protein MELLADRAFT_108161 [Melampsora larici-populina 98AG31]|uniref:Uncharacterized protein n=1 Tax=Melampsora larici-populina (strain 98AG31 / pathotype 3-4-7) TaxID=747676 RepID=F4RS62_MELLP|nr:uncharacterized protein MELLADRAFT_108161 [Melampsora larici-populina 98AG31]EGG04833.1 hypothetical protein MELLADRAFT_108161 [Melampsora larici-populina 98AG31]